MSTEHSAPSAAENIGVPTEIIDGLFVAMKASRKSHHHEMLAEDKLKDSEPTVDKPTSMLQKIANIIIEEENYPYYVQEVDQHTVLLLNHAPDHEEPRGA